MSALNDKKLTSALMHEDSFYAGVGPLKKELNTVHDGISREVTLALEGSLVLVGTKTKAGKDIVLAIPLSNFKHLAYT
jgi:hypothetical protein